MRFTTEMALSLHLLLSIIVSGGSGVKWSVTYSPTSICALEGSSVNMSCSYTYPTHLNVTDAFWINRESGDPVDFSKIVNYKHRVTANCGDKRSRCSLHMTKLTKADALYPYYCRIETNREKGRWIGKPGISMKLTGLQVVSSGKAEEVKDGDHVTLTCNTTCNLTGHPLFIWRKDGRPVEQKQSIHNQLQLHPVSIEDGGNYTCAVRGHEDLPSPPLRLQVTLCHSLLTAALVGVAVCGIGSLPCVIYWLRTCMRKKKTMRDKQQDRNHGNTAQMNSLYQNLNPNTIQPDSVYQSLDPNTMEPDAVYQSLNPNTNQPNAI